MLKANSRSEEEKNRFHSIVSARVPFDELLEFMRLNKTEWSMRVFDHNDAITYPQYILNAIKE